MAIFHVDYINGSNANDGSAATPYATVKYALETNSLGAGDTVKVAGSDLTTRDTAATYDRTIGYKILTTSTDLTGSISVNDVIQINPPVANTAFQGWFTSSVTAISATTITLFDEIELPGTASAGNWTIKTIDSTVLSSVSTLETWISGAGIGVVIEGGYNNTFTSIIGLTYFRRNVPAGQISGTVFSTSGYSAQSINTVTLKNFQFSQFINPLNFSFGVSIYGTNLRVYSSASANALNGTYGQVISPDANPADLYFINSNSSVGSISQYINNFINNGDNPTMNITVFSGTKIPQVGNFVNDLTLWHPGQSSNGSSVFGTTLGISVGSGVGEDTNITIGGNVAFNSIDNDRSGTSKGLKLFNVPSNSGTINFKPTAITVIDGGLSDSWWEFINYGLGFKSTICNFILPTGFNLKDQSISAGNSMVPGSIQAVSVEDDEYSWIGNNSAYVAVDTTDFSTGDSSKVFLFGCNKAYASQAPIPAMFQFTKLATKPTSITMRYKYLANGASSLALNMPINNFASYYVSASNFTTTATNWTDLTFPFDGITNTAWDLIPNGIPLQIGLEPSLQLSGNPILKVDSITVNY